MFLLFGSWLYIVVWDVFCIFIYFFACFCNYLYVSSRGISSFISDSIGLRSRNTHLDNLRHIFLIQGNKRCCKLRKETLSFAPHSSALAAETVRTSWLSGESPHQTVQIGHQMYQPERYSEVKVLFQEFEYNSTIGCYWYSEVVALFFVLNVYYESQPVG